MNINFKKISLTLLFATSCLTKSAHSMDDKVYDTDAERFYCEKKGFFLKVFEEKINCLMKNDENMKKTCDVWCIKKIGESHENPLKEERTTEKYTFEEILKSVKDDPKTFLKTYFSNTYNGWFENNRTTYTVFKKDYSSRVVRKHEEPSYWQINKYQHPSYWERRDKQTSMTIETISRYCFSNYYALLQSLDQTLKGMGRQYSHLIDLSGLKKNYYSLYESWEKFKNLSNEDIDFVEDAAKFGVFSNYKYKYPIKNWKLFIFLRNKNICLKKSQSGVYHELLKHEKTINKRDSSDVLLFENFVELAKAFKYYKENLKEYPAYQHRQMFGILLKNQMPLSEENIEKVMLMTRSIDDEEGSMEEKLKRFNPLVNENYPPIKKVKKWFKEKYKTEPERQDILAARYLMEKGVLETPWLFDIVRDLMERREEITPLPDTIPFEILQEWKITRKEPLTQKHIELGEHLLKEGFQPLNFRQFKAGCYLMSRKDFPIAKPTKLEIEATVHLMWQEDYHYWKAPLNEDINIIAKLMSLGFEKPNKLFLEKTKNTLKLKRKPLDTFTKEDFDEGCKIL